MERPQCWKCPHGVTCEHANRCVLDLLAPHFVLGRRVGRVSFRGDLALPAYRVPLGWVGDPIEIELLHHRCESLPFGQSRIEESSFKVDRRFSDRRRDSLCHQFRCATGRTSRSEIAIELRTSPRPGKRSGRGDEIGRSDDTLGGLCALDPGSLWIYSRASQKQTLLRPLGGSPRHCHDPGHDFGLSRCGYCAPALRSCLNRQPEHDEPQQSTTESAY